MVVVRLLVWVRVLMVMQMIMIMVVMMVWILLWFRNRSRLYHGCTIPSCQSYSKWDTQPKPAGGIMGLDKCRREAT